MDELAASVSRDACPSCGKSHGADARFCSSCGFRFAPTMEVDAKIAEPDPRIGRILADRYRVEALLGRGGMGVVYRVEHVHIGKVMAMKILSPELARERHAARRFRREAEAISRLSHPNTVQIFDYGTASGLTYLVMEYVSGRDLGRILAEDGPLDCARLARLLVQVCASVSEAHAQGIVHRDLKPDNLMITLRGGEEHVKVLDFGLAKLRTPDGSLIESKLTQTGIIVGTPYYMAPEQIRGEAVDGRADVYALGAIFYKAFTGSPVFAGPAILDVLKKHLTAPVPPPSSVRPDPRGAEIDRIVLRAMAKDPAARHPSVDALARELDSLATGARSGSLPAITLREGPRAESLATREDVDAYEHRLRRRGRFRQLLLAAGLLAVGSVAAWVVTSASLEGPPSGLESEPNDERSTANLLREGAAIDGHLGKRISRTRGDEDVFRLAPDPGASMVEVVLSGLPNMDLVLEVLDAQGEQPLATIDDHGFGEGERVPNLPIRAGRHFLRVREKRDTRALPTENVSDAYTIRWKRVGAESTREREPNDALELATPIGLEAPMRGFVGWGGDVDLYCASTPAASVVAELEGVPGIDLRLRIVSPALATSRKVNENGPGGGERSSPFAIEAADATCFEVSADPASPKRASFDRPYRLRLRTNAAIRASDAP